MSKERKIKVGKDSVVIGDVSGDVGDRSVVIGPTDAQGNVILNQTMAVGTGAKAGPGSIAIGAGAGAGTGTDIAMILEEINDIVQNTDDPQLISSFAAFIEAARKPKENKKILSTLWDGIKTVASLFGVADAVSKISLWITAL